MNVLPIFLSCLHSALPDIDHLTLLFYSACGKDEFAFMERGQLFLDKHDLICTMRCHLMALVGTIRKKKEGLCWMILKSRKASMELVWVPPLHQTTETRKERNRAVLKTSELLCPVFPQVQTHTMLKAFWPKVLADCSTCKLNRPGVTHLYTIPMLIIARL